MSISRSIAEGVNLLSGSAREEYAEFVAGWLHFFTAFAKHIDQPLDDCIREICADVSATVFLESIKADGWEPRRGESMRDFDARIKALPIFAQLGLVDGDVEFIESGDTPTPEPDFTEDGEPMTEAKVLARISANLLNGKISGATDIR
jgi:hypothetical protein